jgi:hypothetical protein
VSWAGSRAIVRRCEETVCRKMPNRLERAGPVPCSRVSEAGDSRNGPDGGGGLPTFAFRQTAFSDFVHD